MKLINKYKRAKHLFSYRLLAVGAIFVTLFQHNLQVSAQEFVLEAPSTLNAELQETGEKLLKGKTGSIVAINPNNGEILCLATNSPNGANDGLAIAKAYAPGSTIKPAQALTFLSERIVTPQTKWVCNGGYKNGNIKVGCHKHYSPLMMKDAIALSCNTWFLQSYISMLNNKHYGTKENAVTIWQNYMRSMGLGGPLGVDIPGEKGGLLANVNYLNRRYPSGWSAQTIMWAGMGQGDITVTPLQLCNLAASIANRGYFYTPHIHRDCEWSRLPQRFFIRRQTKVPETYYTSVISAMREVVTKGTATKINTPLFPICGKTGTAENSGKDHSVFMGFAPMNKPAIAVAVYIEHGGWGADVAAPIAAIIMEKYLMGRLSNKTLLMQKHMLKLTTDNEE